MGKNEIKALRRPFVKELFRGNKFNLIMTLIAALFGSIMELSISWLIKEICDLISGESNYDLYILLIVAGVTILALLAGWFLDSLFSS